MAKYIVPEDIADEDAAEFITKAAVAKKAGKKTFTMGGKTYPVTIKTDIPTKKESRYVSREVIDGEYEKSMNKEAYEIGTKKYADYVKEITPGQGDIKQNEDNERNLEEKAVSQQQQKLMGLAYAVKKGEISAPSPEIQKIADSMSLEELKKMAEGKHKDLPVKKEGLDEVNFNKLDARRKEFREKVRKLYYEKIRKGEAFESKKEEKEKKGSKITIDPELKEYKGYDFVKKLKEEKNLSEEEQSILNYIKEAEYDVQHANAATFDFKGTYNPMSGEQSLDIEGPASASSIARALKMSPMKVQELIDRMMKMGMITRVGDAYTYGQTEPAN